MDDFQGIGGQVTDPRNHRRVRNSASNPLRSLQNRFYSNFCAHNLKFPPSEDHKTRSLTSHDPTQSTRTILFPFSFNFTSFFFFTHPILSSFSVFSHVHIYSIYKKIAKNRSRIQYKGTQQQRARKTTKTLTIRIVSRPNVGEIRQICSRLRCNRLTMGLVCFGPRKISRFCNLKLGNVLV